jgi:hypothetical protein
VGPALAAAVLAIGCTSEPSEPLGVEIPLAHRIDLAALTPEGVTAGAIAFAPIPEGTAVLFTATGNGSNDLFFRRLSF